ncbi:MAG: ABC transporter ATP-binding protein [Treponema sp.]|jgi:peptide/nickel transport system ATP-binding protein|nr:ABC transporter ATP-binding protein [Treponema sp.]
MEENIFRVENLSVSFRRYDQQALERSDLRVISDLSLDAREGEIVAVAGASGSGKSLLAHAIMGILPPNASVSGGLYYRGEALDEKKQATLRGREIALIPQSVGFLDPLMRVGVQVAGVKKRDTARHEVFERLGLPSGTERFYPFQLSGGMARRALVATAIISGARLIIADEPTPGMDTRVSLEALRCFRELADEGKSVILITHDIDLAMGIADRLAVFYAGTSVELADARDFIAGEHALRHPYTKALWKALPQNGFEPIAGFQPYAGDLSMSAGCLFAPRCPLKSAACESAAPPMRQMRGGQVRCIHAS